MSEERNEKGQFKKGHIGIGGRPPKAREVARLAVLDEVVKADDWRRICEVALQDATKGKDGQTREKGRRFIADYLVGRPQQTVRFRHDEGGDSIYADLSDDELRAIVARAKTEPGSGEEGATAT